MVVVVVVVVVEADESEQVPGCFQGPNREVRVVLRSCSAFAVQLSHKALSCMHDFGCAWRSLFSNLLHLRS